VTRVDGFERPIFITVKRYTSLPSFKGESAKESAIWYDNFESIVRRALRLKSLTTDLADAIDQVQGGPYRGYFFDEGVVVPMGLQSLEGLRNQKEYLDKSFRAAQQVIQKCMTDPKRHCKKLPNNDISKWLDPATGEKPITASDDLEIRATSPLAANAVSLPEIKGWKAFIGKEGIFKTFAACSIARAIIRNNVEKTANLRCQQDNECLLLKSEVEVYGDYAYRGLIVKPEDCQIESSEFPAVTDPKGVNLGVVPIPAGKTFTIETGSDAGETNSWELKLVCPNNHIATWSGLVAGNLKDIEFPRMNMKCNLEIRAFTPGGGLDTICPNKPLDVDPITYLATPQLLDADNDMVLGQKTAQYQLRFDDYLQVDRDCNDLYFKISVNQ
jgi:hypothetical protein